MKIKLGFIILFCVFTVSLTAQQARSDSIVRVGACETPGITWGVFVQDSFAYVADRSYLTIVNISVQTSPSIIGTISHPAYIAPLGLCVRDTIAYLNCHLLSRFSDVSIADPINPYLLGWCSIYSGVGQEAKGICLRNNLAYVTTGSTGFKIINILFPSSPTVIDSFQTSGISVDLYVDDTIAYIADLDSLLILNVADSTNTCRIGTVDMPNSCYDVFVVDTFAYAVCLSNFGTDGTLQIVNVSDPAAPFIINSVTMNGDPLAVCVSGSYAYVAAADWWSSDKGPRQVGGLRPAWSMGLLADIEGGLRIVDISNPDSITLAATYDTPGDPRDVFTVFPYVYMADYDSLQILQHIIVGVKEEEIEVKSKVQKVRLMQNQPNPFSCFTSISYQLPIDDKVTLNVYDLSGRLIVTLIDEIQHAGIHTTYWDGKDKSGKALSNGIYFYQVMTNLNRVTKKTIVIH